jgi:hypothetical protein
MVETGPLLETVASRVAEALHVPRMVILLGGNGVFRPAYAVVYGASPNGTFTEQRVPIQS